MQLNAYLKFVFANVKPRAVMAALALMFAAAIFSACGASPAWSPDGSRIAFVANGDIYTVLSDGSDVRRLTDNESNQGNPVWSPDGSRIAFVSERDGNLEIYTMAP